MIEALLVFLGLVLALAAYGLGYQKGKGDAYVHVSALLIEVLEEEIDGASLQRKVAPWQ